MRTGHSAQNEGPRPAYCIAQGTADVLRCIFSPSRGVTALVARVFMIFATDAEANSITVARAGVYAEPDLVGLSTVRLKRFFPRQGSSRFKVSVELYCVVSMAHRERLRIVSVTNKKGHFRGPSWIRVACLATRSESTIATLRSSPGVAMPTSRIRVSDSSDANAEVDEAIRNIPVIRKLLQRPADRRSGFDESVAALIGMAK